MSSDHALCAKIARGVRNPFTLTDEGVDHAGVIVVSVTGDLDLWNAPALEQRLGRWLESGRTWLVVDLSQASFLDSSGLGALTASMRRVERKGGRLIVVNTRRQMQRVFELTGLVRVLNVVPSREHALRLIEDVRATPQP
jgi:anti-anti-sigma factor